MKKIQFRALCNVDCKEGDNIIKMVYFTQLELDNGLWFNPDDENIYHINEWLTKPMQLTGLPDKNGVEIYEGDILTKSYYPYIDEGKQNYVSIVEWCFAGFHTVLECVNKDKRGISSGINEPIEFGDEFEIIGNIHEHKHLLK